MKRRLLRPALFLLLGAIVNITVAWGFALQDPTPDPWGSVRSLNDHTLFMLGSRVGELRASAQQGFEIKPSAAYRVVSQTTFNHMLPQSSRLLQDGWMRPVSNSWLDEYSQHLIFEQATGWPCLALDGCTVMTVPRMTYEIMENPKLLIDRKVERTSCLIELKRNEGTPRASLPIRPIWRGFAINTVFYAAVVWLLFAAPFALRRRRRIQRGFCPKCAYPAGSSPVCTECGAAVRASPQRGASTTAQGNALGHDHNATTKP